MEFRSGISLCLFRALRNWERVLVTFDFFSLLICPFFPPFYNWTNSNSPLLSNMCLGFSSSAWVFSSSSTQMLKENRRKYIWLVLSHKPFLFPYLSLIKWQQISHPKKQWNLSGIRICFIVHVKTLFKNVFNVDYG